MDYFQENVKNKMAPNKKQCKIFISLYSVQRDWKSVKNLVKSSYYERKNSLKIIDLYLNKEKITFK